MAEVVLREKGACGILVERGMCVVVIVFGENWPSPHLVWRGEEHVQNRMGDCDLGSQVGEGGGVA